MEFKLSVFLTQFLPTPGWKGELALVENNVTKNLNLVRAWDSTQDFGAGWQSRELKSGPCGCMTEQRIENRTM